MNEEDLAFVAECEKQTERHVAIGLVLSPLLNVQVDRLCTMVREQDKRARHAEQERDAFNARIDELEAELALLKSMPTRKDVALALLRGIGPNPAEFMATGKDAFLGLADRLIEMFNGTDKP